MKTLGTAALRLALMGAAAAIATPALAKNAPQEAQGAQATTVAENAVNAPDDAAAQSDQSDIIVTGTSVARRALDTPLAVTSLDSKQLSRTSGINQGRHP